jgi:subtilisin family serine protease
MKVCFHSPLRSLQRITSILSIALAALTLGSSAGAKPLSTSPALNDVRPGGALSERFLSRRADGTVLVDLLIQGDVPPGLLRARGIEVNTVAGGWLTARCPLGLLTALYEIPGVERVQVSERCQPLLDLSVADAGVSSVRTVGPTDITGQTGQGVVLGLVDTGADLHHADLQNANGSTRIVLLWDQTATMGTPPPGFTYGAEYDSVAINRGLSPETDTDGHGTHVATTAAGNGRATGNGLPANSFVGVAPKADVIMVKTSYAASEIVDGVQYIFLAASALGKKAVVNLSLGTQDGPHDGTYGFDTMINALTGPGKIVCVSAGNKQNDDSHGRLDLDGTTPGSMTLSVPSYSKNPQTQNDYLIFSGWYPGDDQISITITTPGGDIVGPVTPGSSGSLSSGDGFINVHNATTFPSNGDNEIYVEVYDDVASKPPHSGTWTFTFTPVALASTGIVDIYIAANQLGDGLNLARWVAGLAPFGTIGSPGSADSVITVAAHTTKACWTSVDGNTYCWSPVPTLNDIAPFSSHGPLRNGKLKPDLSAPGNGVAAGRSASATFQTQLVVPDGVHVMLSGTSMSAPHVAGTVALMLAQPAWSNATPSAIRQRLESTARTDAFTGAIPNATWGYGKLNAAAALSPLTSLVVTHPPKGFFMPPGKPDSVTVVLGGMTADSIAFDLSMNGGASYPVHLGTLFAVPPGAPRSLVFFVDPAWSTIQAKVRATARNAVSTQSGTSDSLFAVQAPVGVEVLDADLVSRVGLDPSRPNPFNPTTTIGFEIATPGRTTLRIFSAQGALIRTLVDEPLREGRYRVLWDGRDGEGRPAASGVYFSELRADGTRLVRKMSLLK